MRMWNINSELLCNKHLLGEHFEIHCAVGNLGHSGKWTKALAKKGYLEPQNFLFRHNELVKEMITRGFKHNSPLSVRGIKLPIGRIDTKKSIRDLKERCIDCRKKIKGKI